jgi:nicotinate-nucleotide pyrophosphorylase (carboxylating)
MDEQTVSDTRQLISMALVEDLDEYGDVTSQSLVDAEEQAHAEIIAREACCLAGLNVARMVFQAVDKSICWAPKCADGVCVVAGTPCVELSGPLRAILTAERTALNFLQRLSGIATVTRAFVQQAGNTRTRILDTRKTTPGWRRLEKYAVTCGGGTNHRMGLFDMIMIKDNHRNNWVRRGRGGLGDAVRTARTRFPEHPVEIEVESIEDLRSVLDAQPDWILLDNMSTDDMRACVEACAGRCKLEASGGITLDTIAEVAKTGVDAVSLGCLTHSARAVDLSLELSEQVR